MATDFGGSGSRRVFAERLLREARAQASSGVIDLSPSIAGLPVASSVTASDSFPFITASGNGYRGTASLIRDYVLGISGGTATIPENLIVSGNLTVNGNTVLGNATTDTVTLTARLDSGLTWATDNSLDIGASGANRPRRGYFGTEVLAPTVTATSLGGTLTTALQPNVTTMTGLTTIGTLVAGAVPASLVTAGTFGAGAYTFPSTLAVTTNATIGGTLLSGVGAHAAGSPRATIGGGTIQLVLAEHLTNAAQKLGRLGFAHYTNSEEPIAGFVVDSTSTTTGLYIGGGSTAFNAATFVRIYTAANNTTTTGTIRASWDAVGTFAQVGNATIGGTLGVTGATTLSSTLAVASNATIGGTLRHAGGAYVPQVIVADGLQAATDIASVTDVTLATASVPSIAAGDVIVVEFEGTLLNNSGGNRTYTYRFAVGAFAVEGTTSALSTDADPRAVPLSRITIHVRATNDVTGLTAIALNTAARASDAQSTQTFGTILKWKASTTDDITGTQTATLSIRSDNATGTQEFRVFSARILRYAETP